MTPIFRKVRETSTSDEFTKFLPMFFYEQLNLIFTVRISKSVCFYFMLAYHKTISIYGELIWLLISKTLLSSQLKLRKMLKFLYMFFFGEDNAFGSHMLSLSNSFNEEIYTPCEIKAQPPLMNLFRCFS